MDKNKSSFQNEVITKTVMVDRTAEIFIASKQYILPEHEFMILEQPSALSVVTNWAGGATVGYILLFL